jgi:hypothetical protein
MTDFIAQMASGKQRALSRRNAGVGSNMPVYATARAKAIAEGETDRAGSFRQAALEARVLFRVDADIASNEFDCQIHRDEYAALAADFF